MQGMVESFYYRFGEVNPQPEVFEVFDKRDHHPNWFRKAEPVVKCVSEVWTTVGLAFPFDEVMEDW